MINDMAKNTKSLNSIIFETVSLAVVMRMRIAIHQYYHTRFSTITILLLYLYFCFLMGYLFLVSIRDNTEGQFVVLEMAPTIASCLRGASHNAFFKPVFSSSYRESLSTIRNM
mgnify:CR=1 FL=1